MNWDEINEEVQKNGNLKTVTMETLREAMGVAKLGVNVRTQIRKKLASMGIGHIPEQLPTYQHEQVRLYKRGTDVGDMIELAHTPGEENDRKLSEQFGEDKVDYAQVIEQIRTLVSE
jgi:hypothetical protein